MLERERVRNGPKEEPEVYKLSLEERATTPELKKILEELHNEARQLEKDLFSAFLTPTEAVLQEILDNEHIRNRLFALARRARAFGVHHKNYQVGGAILGFRSTARGSENPWVVLFNANTKVGEHGHATPDAQKWCAEQYLMDEARENGVVQIVSFCILAVPRPTKEDPTGFRDDISKRVQITLTPCAECRMRMNKMLAVSDEGPALVTPDTEVATADARFIQLYPYRDRDLEKPSYQKLQRVKNLPSFHGELPPNFEDIDYLNGNGIERGN